VNETSNNTTALDTTNDITTADPWDRQVGEPARWFHRFEKYRLAGPERTLLGVFHQEFAAKNGETQSGEKREKKCKRPSRVQRMPGSWPTAASRWRWKERAEAWDAEQVRRDRAAIQEARNAAVKRHCEIGELAISVSEKKLRSRRFVRRIGPREVVSLVRAGCDVQYRALGLDKPEGAQPPTIHLNLFEQIAARTAEMREQIVRELAERLRQQPPKVVQALPPQDIFDAVAAHDATNVGASKQAPEPPQEREPL
jgi:hypothetical protein